MDAKTFFQKVALMRTPQKEYFKTCDFKDFSPRKGFKCEQHFNK